MSYRWNRNRSFIICPPDCPERKPACHSHCERYKEKRAAYDKRKEEYEGDKLVNQYMVERAVKLKDIHAKNQKSQRLYKSHESTGTH